MKNIHLVLVSFGVIVLAAGCGGGSSSSTSIASKVSITATNADAVAKGGMSPSQAMVKSGSNASAPPSTSTPGIPPPSSTVMLAAGVVIDSSGEKQSVMNIALAQLKRVQGLNIPVAPTSVTGVSLSPFPITFGCGSFSNTSSLNGGIPNTTNGTMTFDVQDTNGDMAYGASDVVTLTFAACEEPNLTNPAKPTATTTTNGSLTLTINSASGSGTAQDPLNQSISMGFTGFTSVDTAPTPSETITMSGGISLGVVNNGTIMTATMSGTSFAMTSSSDGAYTMKDFTIIGTENTLTNTYSFSVSMTTSCAALDGDIVITTPTAFTGTGAGNPTAGVMVISGANNSSVTITANSNDTVTISVNDGTSASQPVLTKTATWDKV